MTLIFIISMLFQVRVHTLTGFIKHTFSNTRRQAHGLCQIAELGPSSKYLPSAATDNLITNLTRFHFET